MSSNENEVYGTKTSRNSGKSAQRMNIYTARLVADAIRSTLGPKGMDKMVVDSSGNITVTNDGVCILKEISVEHPTAKMIVEIAKTQEDEVGDGTTSAVVIAGELLKKAEDLLDNNIHPSIINKGFRLASEFCIQEINKSAVKAELNDETLKKIAITAMTGKGAEDHKDTLSSLLVEACNNIRTDEKIDITNITIEKKTGGTIGNSKLIKGVLIDKEKVLSSMPSEISDARVLLLDYPIQVKSPEIDTKFNITNADKIAELLNYEERSIKELVSKIESSGCNVLFCQKGIDDLAMHLLAKKGIYAVRRVKKSDMQRLSKATGANVTSDLNELDSTILGHCSVTEFKVKDDTLTLVDNCKNPLVSTILIRGSSDHVIDEIKRALDDALGDINSLFKNKKVVSGAGSLEMHLSLKLEDFSNSISGREQLAIKAFSEALQIIPKTLADNAGLDSVDMLTKLKSANKNNSHMGLDVFSGEIVNSFEEGILEPVNIKLQAISSACEVAIMILRIDDIILADPKDDS